YRLRGTADADCPSGLLVARRPLHLRRRRGEWRRHRHVRRADLVAEDQTLMADGAKGMTLATFNGFNTSASCPHYRTGSVGDVCKRSDGTNLSYRVRAKRITTSAARIATAA